MPGLSMRTPILWLAVASALLSTPCSALAPQSDEYPFARAVDGHRGFGRRPALADIEALFRSAEGEDAAFLASLYDLATDVDVFLHLTAALHERRLYFSLVHAERGTLVDLYTAYDRAARAVRARDFDQRTSLALARMAHDARFAARRPVIAAAREEIAELRGALALFVAHTHGLAQLDHGNEVARIAGRADLAAARLRAVRLDLEALHEGWAALHAHDDADVQELAQALRTGKHDREELLGRARRASAAQALSLRDALFTTRFDRGERAALAQRRKDRLEAQSIERRLRVLLPEMSGDEGLPADVARMSRAERYRDAAELGREALERDPFAAELNYLVGLAVDFAAGLKAASPYFDRFLALRGIRHYDDSTYDNARLDAFERYALFRVADWTATGPRGADRR